MKRLPAFAAATLALSLGAASAQRLTIWTDFTTVDLEWLTRTTKAFEATPAAKGATFQVVSIANGELRDKFIKSAPAGQGPDLAVTVPHDQIGGLVAAGVVEQMDKYLTVSVKQDIQQVALDAMSYQGKTFGVPMYGEAVAIVYNKKLLPGGVPTTWDGFIKAAQGLTKPEQQQFGFLAPIGIQYYTHGFYRAFGSYVFGGTGKNLDAADVGLNNAGAVKAGQLINDLRFKYNLIPEGAENYDTENDLFSKGKVAMWLTGPWATAGAKKAGIDYGVGQLPRPTGATRDFAPFVGVRGAVLNAYSRNKAVAAEFAKYISAPERQVSLNQAGGRVPVSKKALAQLTNNIDVKGFGAAIARGVPMPNIPAMDKVWGPWGDAVSLLIKSGNADVKGIHDKAVQTIKASIR